jgi:hypothetical protein
LDEIEDNADAECVLGSGLEFRLGLGLEGALSENFWGVTALFGGEVVTLFKGLSVLLIGLSLLLRPTVSC